jgi:speckle-type POZ protein
MDCCLCSSLGNSYRPPRNTVCVSCYEGARSIIDLCRKLEQEWRDDDNDDDDHHLDTSSSSSSSSSENNNRTKQLATPPQGLAYAFKQMKHLELKEEDASEKLEFLESLVDAFRLGMHSDVELVTNDGLSLHAHRVVMVSTSLSLSLSACFSLSVLVQDHS